MRFKSAVCLWFLGFGLLGLTGKLCAQGGTWTTKAPMPTARGHVASGVINNILYVVGGAVPGIVGTNEAYDQSTNTWQSKASMPTARALQGTNGAVVNGLLYVIGGNASGSCTSANEAYDPATNSWASLAPMPTARCHLAVAALNGLIYAMGGTVGLGAFSTVEVYNPATDSWSTAAPMPTARWILAAVALNNHLYALGGYANTSLATNESYDPSTNSWSTKAPMPTPLSDFRADVAGGLIYAIGGFNANGLVSPNYVYDPSLDSWSANVPPPTPRCCMGLGVVGGVFYLAGGFGSSSPSPLSINEAFTPAQYTAAIQPPIKADGSSVFNASRGVVPVKFTLALNGAATCQLPAATISLTRTAGGAPGPINQGDYTAPSDNGSNFRVDTSNCQYVYNLATGSLGPGTYLVQISISGVVAGSGTFGLQ